MSIELDMDWTGSRLWQILLNLDWIQTVNLSDVVEIVTSKTETWLKPRDRDFAVKAETETWKFES